MCSAELFHLAEGALNEYDRNGGFLRGLVVEFLIDLVSGLLEAFRGLCRCFVQLPLNLLSNMFVLDLLPCFRKSLSNLVSDFLGSVSNAFHYTGLLRRPFLGQDRGT